MTIFTEQVNAICGVYWLCVFPRKKGPGLNLPCGLADITESGRFAASRGLAVLLFVFGPGFAGFGGRNLIDFGC